MGKHREPTDPDGPEFFNRRPLDGSAWLSELGWTHSDADRRLRGFANELKAIFIEIHENVRGATRRVPRHKSLASR